MNVNRTGQSAAPAILVALSMAVCLGAAVNVTAATQHARADRSTTFTAAEREALASLLACLSDTARQFKPDQQQARAPFAVHRLPGTTFVTLVPTGLTEQIRHDPLGPGTLARTHLLNLPPPGEVSRF
ncbi:MAG: hypothetical protein WDZ31_09370 [Phycisphaeraceae bacterium]